jgi:hypothetical protein
VPILKKAPPELIDYMKSGRCSVFVGAGFSRSLGLPLWDNLIHAIVDQLKDRSSTDLDLVKKFDSLQIAQMYVDSNAQSRIPLNDLVDREFGRAIREFDEQHIALCQLPIREILSTNWDRAIEAAFLQAGRSLKVIYRNDEVASWGTSECHLLKLHGDIADKESLVFTHEDYLDYVDRHRPIEDLARSVLLTKAVLFIGFSLTDPHFQSLFGQLQYLPRKSKYQAYAVFIQQPPELLEYWSNRGFSIIALDSVASPEEQLREFMSDLVGRTATTANSSLQRIRLLVRETADHLKYAGERFTLRIRAALGPFGSPPPNQAEPVFSDSADLKREHDNLEWQLHDLVRQYIEKGSIVKLICAPGGDGLLRKYTPSQAKRRLASFIQDVKNFQSLQVVYDQGNLERNLFVLGDSALIDSRKEHSRQKLYSYARLVTEREQVTTMVAQFDNEFEILSRLANLEAGQTGMTARERVLEVSEEILRSIT